MLDCLKVPSGGIKEIIPGALVAVLVPVELVILAIQRSPIFTTSCLYWDDTTDYSEDIH